jgi:hypothetical protein
VDYLVRRGEQEFGPYTLAELQQYVQSGNVLLDDLTKNEAMTDWGKVSSVLGTVPLPSFAGRTEAIVEEIPPQTVELPWNLHWVVLLILVAITRQLFNFIWVFVLANWARKLTGNNKPLVLVAMYPAAFLAAAFAGGLSVVLGAGQAAVQGIAGVLVLAGVVAYLMGIFSIRSAMEEYYNSTENIGLVLSGVLTFFFGSIYLQYHVNRLARWKKSGVLL